MDLKDIIITLRLRPDQVNLVLNKLGQCPFTEVVEVIAAIKSQGDAAIEMAQRQQQLMAAQPAADAPPVPNGLDKN